MGATVLSALLVPVAGVSGAVAAPACDPEATLHLELVIDDSKSMADSDPRGLRVSASQLVVSALPDDDIVGAVEFGHTVRTIFGPFVLSGTNRDLLRARLAEGLDASGTATLFGPAIARAREELARTSAERKAVIFLSDGVADDPAQTEHRTLGGVPIFSVGLGAGGHESLRRLATETGGRFALAESPEGLVGEFSKIVTALRCEQTGGRFSDVLSDGQSVTRPVKVPPGAAELGIRSSWALGRFRVSLQSPRGARFQQPGLYGGGTAVTTSGTFAAFRVPNPRAGTWRLTITALSGTTAARVNTAAGTRMRALAIKRIGGAVSMVRGRAAVRFSLSRPAPVRVLINRAGARRVVRAYTVPGRIGRNRVVLTRARKGKVLAKGAYRVRLQAGRGKQRVSVAWPLRVRS